MEIDRSRLFINHSQSCLLVVLSLVCVIRWYLSVTRSAFNNSLSIKVPILFWISEKYSRTWVEQSNSFAFIDDGSTCRKSKQGRFHSWQIRRISYVFYWTEDTHVYEHIHVCRWWTHSNDECFLPCSISSSIRSSRLVTISIWNLINRNFDVEENDVGRSRYRVRSLNKHFFCK
jgi:hypothetical protein